MPAEPRVMSVGYQGTTAEALAQQLESAGVETVVDVRLTPQSRKRGFSRKTWAAILREHDIDYLHRPALGNPRDNRPGFAQDADTEVGRAARDRYRALLAGDTGRAAIDELVALAAEQRIAVMCFEESEAHCHRSEVVRQVTARLDAQS